MAARTKRELMTTISPQNSALSAPFLGTLVAILISLLPIELTHAHPIDMAIVNITLGAQGGKGALSLRTLASSSESPRHIQDNSNSLATMLLGEFIFEQTLSRCSPEIDQAKTIGANLNFDFELVCSSGATGESLRIERDPLLLSDFPEKFLTVFLISRGDRIFSVTMRRDDFEQTIEFPINREFKDIVFMGMAHIGATPSEWITSGNLRFPEGIDHVLFVLTLVLANTSFISLLKTVTGFTLGHSASLAYVTLRGRSIAPALVEPAIAFSIAVMALISMRRNRPGPAKSPWIVAATFGALHGCGFGSALLESGVVGGSLFATLLGFNIGVEVGQLLLVIGFLVPLSIAARTERRRKIIVVTIGTVVFSLAIFWTIERLASAFLGN